MISFLKPRETLTTKVKKIILISFMDQYNTIFTP